jgi:hypothetical protein
VQEFNEKIVQRAQETIKQKFNLSSEKSYELAIQALRGLDSHGGDCSDWQQIKSVIDVVVKSWVKGQ